MVTYLVLFSFTQQGIEQIADSPARVTSARNTIRKMGGEVRAFYGILGSEHDTLFIVEAASDEKIAEMLLAIARLGFVRTRTHRLFDEDTFARIIAALPPP